MAKEELFDALILSGGNARRLEQHRKVIDPHYYPQLSPYWHQEGPKGLTILMVKQRPTPLLDLHLQPLLTNKRIINITLGLGFSSQMIIDYYQSKPETKHLNFTQEAHPAGTIAPLLQCYLQGKLSDRPLIMSNGDNLLNIDYAIAYQQGLEAIEQLALPRKQMVINILTKVPLRESSAYGVVRYNPQTLLIEEFLEKQLIEDNPYVIEHGQQLCYINSGFSIILHPKTLIEQFVEPEVFRIMQRLLENKVDYKKHELSVKYETLYSKLAKLQRMIGVYYPGFWADSGSEKQILEIEAHYHKEDGK